MNVLMIILRLIHIIAGVFWMGVGFTNVLFISPSARALGQDGQKFMAYLVQRTRFSVAISVTAGLTLLTGLWMYWQLYEGINLGSGYAWGMTLGGLFGIVAFIIFSAFIGGPTNRMKAILDEIEAAGGPPSPEQVGEMQALGERIGKAGVWATITGLLALIGMSIAQYLTF